MVATLQFSDSGGRPVRFCLTCVTAAQAPSEKPEADHSERVAGQTADHCARTRAVGGNPGSADVNIYNFWPKCHAHGMDDAAALLEIEAINQLKARYCRYLDAKDWETWRAIFTDEQEAFRESFRRFIADEVRPHYLDWERAGIIPRELYAKAASMGFASMSVPEPYGGAGIHDFRFNVVVGEGGSGGALALSVGDRLLMMENAIFSVIGPEAASTILYRDSAHTREVASQLKLTARDLFGLRLVDRDGPIRDRVRDRTGHAVLPAPARGRVVMARG